MAQLEECVTSNDILFYLWESGGGGGGGEGVESHCVLILFFFLKYFALFV